MKKLQSKIFNIFCAVIILTLLTIGSFDRNAKSSLVFDYLSSADTLVQVFYDENGKGFDEKNSTSQFVTNEGIWREVRLSLSNNNIRSLRFDPSTKEGKFAIKNVRIIGPYGRVFKIPLSAFQSEKDIHSLKEQDGFLEIQTVVNAVDPIIVINLKSKLYLAFGSRLAWALISLKYALFWATLLLICYCAPHFIAKTALHNKLQRLALLATNYKILNPWIFCFCLSYITSFQLSGLRAPTLALDPSWQAVLEYAAYHDFQFGTDVVFTYGPLGFLFRNFGKGLLMQERILFSFVWSALIAWSVTGLARQISGKNKLVFLAWFFVFSIGVIEQPVFLVIAYSCTIFIFKVPNQKKVAPVFLVALAFLSLIKFTFFIAATVCIIICIIDRIYKRDVIFATFIAFIFTGSFLALWLATGQHLNNLVTWVKGSLEITEGYSGAMAILPKLNVLIPCVTAGILFLVGLLIIILAAQSCASVIGVLLSVTFLVFLTWKHGFVRADSHVFAFITFLPLAFSILLSERMQNIISCNARRYLNNLYTAIIVLCLFAADFKSPGIFRDKLANWPSQVSHRADMLEKLLTGRWQFTTQPVTQLPITPDLKVAKAIIGNAPVDVMNYLQWAALSNALNYHPRPVIQGYSAYTAYLQNLNLAFFQSDQRPSYLLFKMETIDGRFPTLDDATSLLYIFNNYIPVSRDGDFLILHQPKEKPSGANLELLYEKKLRFDESFDLRPWNQTPLVMQVTMRLTVLGKAKKFFFQPPEFYLLTHSLSKEKSFRFIPSMAEEGFLINPLIETNDDVVNLLTQGGGNQVDSINFIRPAYSWGQVYDEIQIRLYRVDSLPAVQLKEAKVNRL